MPHNCAHGGIQVEGRLKPVVVVIEVCELFRLNANQGPLTGSAASRLGHVKQFQTAPDQCGESTCAGCRGCIQCVGNQVSCRVKEVLVKAAIVNLSPQSAQGQKLTIRQRAPKALPAVEAALGTELRQGNAARELSDDLLDALTSAYREAATVTTAST